MKKTISVLMTSLLITATLVGCAGKSEGGTLTLGGSTSVEKVIGSMMEAYMAQNKDIAITYAPTGSSTGVQGAGDGTLDIGLSSRGLKDEEKETMDEIIFALDGIAVVVNTDNTVTDMDMETLAKICTGEIANWSELGGADGEIVVIGRDAASGTRDGFESVVGVKESCNYAEEQASTGAVLASVQANAGAIGYISLSAVDEKITPVSIDGVAPSAETIKDGSYPIQRPFVFAVKSDSDNEVVEAFTQWAVSEATTQMVTSAGAIPIS